MIMRFLVIFFLICLQGCALTGGAYGRFYTPLVSEPSAADFQLLPQGGTPRTYQSANLAADVEVAASKGYAVLGTSSFNGELEGLFSLKMQARRVGATLVLYNSTYAETQHSTLNLAMPDNKTTYSSGSYSGNVSNPYGTHVGGYNGTYSGTSTTYGTQYVPMTFAVRRYDQAAVFLAKLQPWKVRAGIQLQDLRPDTRALLQRNTGALISLVVEGTPAFNANVLKGDVLVSIDGLEVRTKNDALAKLAALPDTPVSVKLGLLRNGEMIQIPLDLPQRKVPPVSPSNPQSSQSRAVEPRESDL